MDVDINDIADRGVVKDVKAYQLPPEVWTEAYNMISRNKAMEAMKGYVQVFGTPLYAPHFAIPLNTQSESFWIYTSLTKAGIYDGNSHTDLTRTVGGDYSAPDTKSWNGSIFAGIPILNNGTDVPQFWAGGSIATKLAALTNWPATTRAKVIRNFGAYLIALNVTVNATVYPHLVKWSSEATDPGTLPASWDETDATQDAGEYDLPDVESGVLVEGRQLGTKMFLYKNQSIWQMRFIGGRAVFAIDQFSDANGILAPRCVTTTGDGRKHVVATMDDIVIHDGVSAPVSILEEKMRKAVFENLDPTNYANSFMFRDLVNSNVIFAYPQLGDVEPSRGVVFNYRNGALTECDIDFCNASSGSLLESSDAETWASAVGTWDSDTSPWNSFSRRELLLCDKANSKFHRWNVGYTRNGVSYETTLRRTSLSIIGKKRNGDWIEDHQKQKYVDRLWPKISGGPILCRFGYQQTVDGAIEWGPYKEFDPLNDVTVDIEASGRAICVEFTSPTAKAWSLDGYKLPIQVLSEF